METPKITWSRRASIQFENAQNFIAAYDELAADDFLDEALALIDGILDNAYIGRKVPEYDLESVRERICKAFRIIYRVGDDKNIEILAATTMGNCCQIDSNWSPPEANDGTPASRLMTTPKPSF